MWHCHIVADCLVLVNIEFQFGVCFKHWTCSRFAITIKRLLRLKLVTKFTTKISTVIANHLQSVEVEVLQAKLVVDVY